MATEKLVTVTERARLKAVQTREVEDDGADLALWLEVQPAGMEWSYDLFLDDKTNIRPGDVVQEEEGLTIVIPADSVDNIKGATLDLSRNLLAPGWTIDNPNTPVASPAVGTGIDPADLTGTVEERVTQVLEMVINPSIASHGGRADLDHVEGDTAFLRLSGGCQGCGMASVTLSQGIKVALTQAVPEITDVQDVTDHASGSQPYFSGSKK